MLLAKDRDLEDERAHPGPPPKVILLRIGNTDTDLVMALLTRNEAKIRAFETSPERMLTLK